MPKAKPVSLHPLNFDEALNALIRVEPKPKPRKRRRKRQRKGKLK